MLSFADIDIVQLGIIAAASLVVACGLVFCAQFVPRLYGQPSTINAVQSAHSRPTPRVGGIAIFSALVLSVLFVPADVVTAHVKFFAAALILFGAGLAEDLGFGISPRWRLAAAVVSSFAVVLALNIYIPRLNIPYLDGAISFWVVGVCATLFVTAAVANAFNLIDGVNGLSGFTGILAAMSLAGISAAVGNEAIFALSTTLAAAVFGFLLVNYPKGRIFLGDAGAYTMGFVLAWFGIALLNSSPEVSAWAILLTVYWPLCDTLIAIYRRSKSKKDKMAPDRLHAHQLVMRSLEIMVLGRDRRHLANPLSTAILAPFVAMPPMVAVLFWDKPLFSFVAAVVFLVLFWGSYFAAGSVVRRYRLRQAMASVGPRPRKPVLYVPPVMPPATNTPVVHVANVALPHKTLEAVRR
jgi:UDP-N-acetylmuramyl pentapeptide phosphotransferase/UDP-N-acetylglucosamine-1-phosphate transferase